MFAFAAGWPWGLAAENPGVFADAASSSQFNDTSVCFFAVPRWVSAGIVCATWLTPRQLACAFRSPTMMDTTGVRPALVMAAFASLYFCPTTSGVLAAYATAVPDRKNTDTTETAAPARPTAFLLNIPTWCRA